MPESMYSYVNFPNMGQPVAQVFVDCLTGRGFRVFSLLLFGDCFAVPVAVHKRIPKCRRAAADPQAEETGRHS